MILFESSLTKLNILAYLDREMKKPAGGMEAMYNPESINLTYSTTYVEGRQIDNDKNSNHYTHAKPGNLSLSLLFDAQLPGNTKPLDDQLSKLRDICCAVDGRSREPHFLKIVWGKQMSWNGRGYFLGRMVSMSVRYTLFDRNAKPLRAMVDLVLSADDSLYLQGSATGINMPVISTPTVPDMTPLPLMAAMMGASAVAGAFNYLLVAVENNLDNLDAAEPGDTLIINSDQGEG